MASSSEFSAKLALLRQERGVSQRTAAKDLGISQALLSHYENGVREPGLAFVVKACDYYHVSADFILGRTLSRDGAMLSEEDVLNAADQGSILRGSVLALLNAKLLAGAEGVLFELLGKLGSTDAIHAAAAELGTAVYTLFNLEAETFAGGIAPADRALSEAKYARALRQLREDKAKFPDLTDAGLAQAFPGRNQSVTQVLHGADSRLSGLTER